MNPAEQKKYVDRIYAAVQALAAAFNVEPDQPLLLAYRMGLEGLPIIMIEEAARRAIQTEEFMPKVAHLRKLCGAEASPETRAQLAFDMVGRMLGAVGTYRSVVFDDPITNATIQSMGGWVALGEKTESEWLTFTKADWIKSYKANYEARRGTMAVQLGTADRSNGAGVNEEKVIRIGVDLPKVPGLSYERVEKRLERGLPENLKLKGPDDE